MTESVGRRKFLKYGLGAAVAVAVVGSGLYYYTMPKVPGAKKVVVYTGAGVHVEFWKWVAEHIATLTNGRISLEFLGGGSSEIYAKAVSEIDSGKPAFDIFWMSPPFTQMLALDKKLEALPYSKMPNTADLPSSARYETCVEHYTHPFGLIGYNANFVKDYSEFKSPPSWEEFTNPKWQGKIGWADPRGFPMWVPAVIGVYKNAWVDLAKRVDKNVKAYYASWFDYRTALQRGDVALGHHFTTNTMISNIIEGAPVYGVPIMEPKKALCKESFCMGIVKNAPNFDAAVEVVNYVCGPDASHKWMDWGGGFPNNPKAYPHPLWSVCARLGNFKAFGVDKREDFMEQCVQSTDWFELTKKLPEYVKQWESEVLKK